MATRIADHVQQALARLLEQFKGLPKIQALVTLLVEPTQDVEDSLGNFPMATALETAVGAQLDGLGQLVGEPRAGRVDESYRLRLRSRILANRSSGTIPELIQVMRLLVPPEASLVVEEGYPAGFTIRIAGAPIPYLDDLGAVLYAARSGGVYGILKYNPTDDAHAFCFAGGAGLGFGDATNPAVGGQMVGAVTGG